jgi:hypothetical protein
MEDLSFTKRDSEKMEEIVIAAISKILMYASEKELEMFVLWKKEKFITSKFESFIEKTMELKIASMNDCDLYEIAKSLGFKLEEGEE